MVRKWFLRLRTGFWSSTDSRAHVFIIDGLATHAFVSSTDSRHTRPYHRRTRDAHICIVDGLATDTISSSIARDAPRFICDRLATHTFISSTASRRTCLCHRQTRDAYICIIDRLATHTFASSADSRRTYYQLISELHHIELNLRQSKALDVISKLTLRISNPPTPQGRRVEMLDSKKSNDWGRVCPSPTSTLESPPLNVKSWIQKGRKKLDIERGK